MATWSFLTNHARALLCIARNPGMRLRDIAAVLGITERSAYAIVAELTDAGYLVKNKDGRRNHYEIQGQLPLRGTIGRERTIGEVLDVLVEASALRRNAPTRHARGFRTTTARAWRRWRVHATA
jgi:DNA-binding IscR family transcriptional regulator